MKGRKTNVYRPDLITECTDGFSAVGDRSIHSLIKKFSYENGVFFHSCVDVGCGRSRYDRWFMGFDRSRAPKSYLAVETDDDIIDELRADNVDARRPEQTEAQQFELSLAIEVIEHLTAQETKPFLEYIRSKSNGLVALTTPNIEYWRVGGPTRGNRAPATFRVLPPNLGLRWLPDHVPTYDPLSDHGHVHKQLFTPATLRDVLEDVFSETNWSVRVYRAWPWILQDATREDHVFHLYFKLFALVWRRDFLPHPRREGNHDLWL